MLMYVMLYLYVYIYDIGYMYFFFFVFLENIEYNLLVSCYRCYLIFWLVYYNLEE